MNCRALEYSMFIDEKWSYTYEQIERYLLECGAIKDGAVYSLEDCSVRLESLPDRSSGHLTFPQTRVIFDGDGAETFYHGFRLRFLNGGG